MDWTAAFVLGMVLGCLFTLNMLMWALVVTGKWWTLVGKQQGDDQHGE